MTRKTLFATVITLWLAGPAGAVLDLAASPSWIQGESHSAAYREARQALRDEAWDDAERRFGEVAAAGGAEAAAALYWQAYARYQSGRPVAALETLQALLAAHPESPWGDDARALQVEIRGPSEDVEDDEDLELKLYALNGLMSASPERALPLLERVLDGDGPRELRERALFIIANNGGGRGGEILRDVALGKRSPDLRRRAVEYLGVAGDNEELLIEIYRDTPDVATRENVLHGLMISGDREALLEIASSEGDRELRGEAIQMLAVAGGRAEIRELYESETDPELREALLETTVVSGDDELLRRVLETAEDQETQIKAIHLLGVTGGRDARELLVGLYGREASARVREEVLEAMMVAGDEDGLYEVARGETDPALQEKAIEMLAVAGGREQLREMWSSAADASVKKTLIESAVVSGDAEILRLALADGVDPDLRRKAVETMGVVGDEESFETLRALYATETDRQVKETVLQALMVGGDSEGLLEIVRSESDAELKREALRYLAMSGSDEAMEAISEVID